MMGENGGQKPYTRETQLVADRRVKIGTACTGGEREVVEWLDDWGVKGQTMETIIDWG